VGLVPVAPTLLPFLGFSVKGPMARSVSDTAFLLSVMAGSDLRDPFCYPSNPEVFARPLDRSFNGVRIAWCPDLAGLPLDRRVRSVLEHHRKTFENLGCLVEDACPDLSGADEVFLTIRAWNAWTNHGPLLEKHRNKMKPEAVWQLEFGARLTAADITQAMVHHGEILQRVRQFQEKYGFMLCAVNQVPPFDAKLDWPKEIEGTSMEHYVSWMKSAYWITVTFCPAMSVPAGFTSDGLPVGLQIVGRYRDDLGVLQIAHAFEQATGFGRKRPAIAQS
jgi:amidase